MSYRNIANRLRPVLVGVCLTMSFGLASAQNGFDRKAWLNDYATLKQGLEKRYSNLAWFGSFEGGVDLPGLDRRTLSALKHAKSDADARSALLNFVADFHDGHFKELGALDASHGTVSDPERPEYSRQDAAGGCAALGYASNDPSFSLPFEQLRGFRLLSDGIDPPFRAGVWEADNLRIGLLRIPVFRANSFPALCLKAWTQPNVWDEQGKLKRKALDETIDLAWYQALADLLARFKQDGAAAVLLDVGRNSGGGDQGDIAARIFTSIPLHSSALWMTQDATVSSPYFDQQLKALQGRSISIRIQLAGRWWRSLRPRLRHRRQSCRNRSARWPGSGVSADTGRMSLAGG